MLVIYQPYVPAQDARRQNNVFHKYVTFTHALAFGFIMPQSEQKNVQLLPSIELGLESFKNLLLT